jgi:hypothetical protein
MQSSNNYITDSLISNCNLSVSKASTRWMVEDDVFEAVGIEEFQKRTGLTRGLIRRLAADGEIPSLKLGETTRYLVKRLKCPTCNPIEQWDITKAARYQTFNIESEFDGHERP